MNRTHRRAPSLPYLSLPFFILVAAISNLLARKFLVDSAFAGIYIPIMSPAWFSLWGCNSPPPFRQVLPSNVKLRVLLYPWRGNRDRSFLSLSRFTADFNSAENLHTLPKFTRCIARGIPALTLPSVIYFLATIRDYESFQSWERERRVELRFLIKV